MDYNPKFRCIFWIRGITALIMVEKYICKNGAIRLPDGAVLINTIIRLRWMSPSDYFNLALIASVSFS